MAKIVQDLGPDLSNPSKMGKEKKSLNQSRPNVNWPKGK